MDLWELIREEEAICTLTVAAVEKKGSSPTDRKTRKILMTCPFNEVAIALLAALGQAFDYGVQAGAALAQVDVRGGYLAVASVDQSNAFTHVFVPRWWRAYMAGPKVRASELPQDWVRGRWPADTWLRPQYRRLPMGHVYAVFVLALINLELMRRVRNLWR